MNPSVPAQKNRTLRIRDIDLDSHREVDLIATRMRDTLIEVEGEAVADKLHSQEWIRQRLLWHVTGAEVLAKVMVATMNTDEVIGHTILRREVDEGGNQYGLIATTYVVPAYRKRGIANQLLLAGEQWFNIVDLNIFSTWTSARNHKLIGLYMKNGYKISESGLNEITGTEMVKLTKPFRQASHAASI